VPAVAREQSDVFRAAVAEVAQRLRETTVQHTVEVISPPPQVHVSPEVRALVQIGKLDIPPARVDVDVRLDSMAAVLAELRDGMRELLAIARAPRVIELRDAEGDIVRRGRIMVEGG
jgi:hypothetical protein